MGVNYLGFIGMEALENELLTHVTRTSNKEDKVEPHGNRIANLSYGTRRISIPPTSLPPLMEDSSALSGGALELSQRSGTTELVINFMANTFSCSSVTAFA